MDQILNAATLRGEMKNLPEFSHENHGKKFYRFILEVERLSGAIDAIPVIAEDTLLSGLDPTAGNMIRVSGQVRSHNVYTESARKLLIFLFAAEIAADEGAPENTVELNGILCKNPVIRRTPLGRQICDLMLAVPRSFHRADYLPCILWGRTAEEASECVTGDAIHISGRIQSRIYTKVTETGTEQRTAYEISAMEAEPLEG